LEVGRDLAELWRRGHDLWPDVPLSEERFRELVEAAGIESEEIVDVRDLYLACAWSEGVPEAGRIFARDCLAAMRGRLGRMGLARAQIDEVAQLVCERMLERESGGPAKLIRYAQQGRLTNFIVVTGTHIALDLMRRAGRELGDHDLLELASISDPRSELLSRETRDIFKTLVEAAIAALSSRHKTLLRLHIVDGVALDEIAAYYGVHRVTVSRWLAAARATLVERARELARTRFGMSDTEFEIAYTGSRLGLSLERLLSD
jgi:RNA polymerase sigma-70 factor (ECF subfamily)